MPRNPIYTAGRDAQNMGVNTPAKGAEPHKSYIQHNNEFNLTYKQGATLRYADVHPFFVMDGLPADRIPLHSEHLLRSYTLQAPLENELYLHKSMTMVPMKAILPNTWERFIVNPTKGDDVPDDVYCNIDLFPILEFVYRTLQANLLSSEDYVKAVIILETIFSRGSLLANLKIDFSSLWSRLSRIESSYNDFDEWFDTSFFPWLNDTDIYAFYELGDGVRYRISLSDSSENSSVVSPHTFFEALRDGCEFHFTSLPEDLTLQKVYISNVLAAILQEQPNLKFDVSRAVAYQLSCVACLTDDSIDNIYTDSLFRNMMFDIVSPDFFEYNGEPIMYDVFSQNRLMAVLETGSPLSSIYQLFTLLFSFRRSLKFSDYFIDARPEPYSVGAMSSEVKDGMVQAIDVTISILKQRFLNWSNRVGNKFFDYIKTLTGVNPSSSNDETKYIVHETFPVRGFEVENTGSEQRENLTVTTLLKTENSKYLYDIELSDYCILLGLAHFDMERMYVGIVDRLARKENRFDYFNKFFQYSGDQDIKRSELNSAFSNGDEPMAYITRHMQYKTSVNHATGGFATGALPGWLNTADYYDFSLQTLSVFGINPEFIRNHSVDMDKFYSSLTAVSLGNYFHFSIRFNTIVHASRQMAIAPDIL